MTRTPSPLRSGFLLLALGVVGMVQGRPVPEPLAGGWTSSSVSSRSVRDRATGSYAAPSGNIITYRINPDGSFHTEVLIQSSMYQCTTNALITEDGYLQQRGTGVVFIVRGGHVHSTDNCRPQWNYEKPATPKQHIFTSWKVDHDRYGERLCLTEEDGKLGCLYRK